MNQREKPKGIQSQIENVDVVKMKLKQARDKIKGFIAKKQADVNAIDQQIKEKLPKYEQTKNKKELLPLLKAKKDLLEMIEKGDVRLKLVNEKLAEVELQQLNKEVRHCLCRLLMCSTIPTSIFGKSRTPFKPKIGGTCSRRLRTKWRLSGLMIGRRSRRIQLSSRCGRNWVAIK